MLTYKFVGYVSIGAVIAAVFVETFVGIDSRQPHIELSQYNPTPIFGNNAAIIGTPTVYQGSANFS